MMLSLFVLCINLITLCAESSKFERRQCEDEDEHVLCVSKTMLKLKRRSLGA
jgi:hypothetical protein